jgi:hypothetical protein
MKGLSGVTRAKTAVTTAGFANPMVSTAETGGAATLAILAVAFPVAAFLLVLGIVIFAFKMLGKILARWRGV